MTESGILRIFASHPFLGDLSPQHRLVLACGVRPFQAAPGEYLAREGNPAHSFLLIQAGQVDVLTNRPDRGPALIQTVGAGDIVGWSWLVPPHRWQFDCRARDQVQGLCFDGNWLRQQCEDNHELGYHILRKLLAVLAGRLAATRKQLSSSL